MVLTIGYNPGSAISAVSVEYMKAIFAFLQLWMNSNENKNFCGHLGTRANFLYDAILDAIL